MSRAVMIASALLVVLITPATSQVDPRAPGAIALPELGRLDGSLRCVTAMDESFGRQIYPIGDVSGDLLNDWILTHRRCDTSFNGYAVVELLLYHGVRDGLPPASAGIRIGPTEIDADCSFIGAGDYDGDGHRDIAISQRIMSDPFSGEYFTSSLVIFWNDGDGGFSIADTTHLTAPNQRVSVMFPDNERWASVPESCDLDRDGVEDLVVATFGWQRVDMVQRPFPRILVYRGNRGTRWGRAGVPTAPAWQLWQRFFTRRVSVLDHDGDGALDIVMYTDDDETGAHGGIAVAYGNRGTWPDTVPQAVDFVRIDKHDGKRAEFIDVTGDRVPELIVSTGDTVNGRSWLWLVYVGRRGQRLLEQFGSGNDAPRPGDSLWWGRPWTIIQTPHDLNRSWNGPMHGVLDAGDIGLDGVGDFCVYNFPSVNCYNGGRRLDSYIDTWMNVSIAGMHDARVAMLGSIDGSGLNIIGVPLGDGGVSFIRPSRSVPTGGVELRLPEGSDRPAAARADVAENTPSATLSPNPAAHSTTLRWHARGATSTVALIDLEGRELRRWLLVEGVDALTIELTGLPAGIYFVSVASGSRTVSVLLIHAESIGALKPDERHVETPGMHVGSSCGRSHCDPARATPRTCIRRVASSELHYTCCMLFCALQRLSPARTTMRRRDNSGITHRGTGCPSKLASMRPLWCAALFAGAMLVVASAPVTSQVDPRAPGAIALPELGRLDGSLRCVTAMNESFGRQIYPVGDVNGDSLNDWILTHRRCDTSFNGRAVIELLLYHGVRDGLPPASAGIRLGPTEIDADCSFIGAGDYDGDGHRDIAISQSILGDEFTVERTTSSIVVFWNDGLGSFAVLDTSHLTAPKERVGVMASPDNERWVRAPQTDVNSDGMDDLAIATFGVRFIDRMRKGAPRIIVFAGVRGRRWGRDGAPTAPAWQLWQLYFTRRVSLLDHDGDGALDIVMYTDVDENGAHGGIAVAYGNRGTWPDTVPQAVDFVRIDKHDGKRAEFIDVTGDRVPELIVSTGDTVNGRGWLWLVYVGRRGQRLLEQYGSGNDAPRPGDSLWWGRPWTIIQSPHALNPSWNGPMHGVLDAGDIGLDGVGDFCVYNFPSVNCYNGGRRFDSYIDAWMNVWLADLHDGRISRLGDVDGSGVGSIGVPHDGGGVSIFKPSRGVPAGGIELRLPEGSDRPASTFAERVQHSFAATLSPNPAAHATTARWFGSTNAVTVALIDLEGRELRRWLMTVGVNELAIDLTGLPAGTYFVRLASDDQAAVLPLVHGD